jgi:hypothetical protein
MEKPNRRRSIELVVGVIVFIVFALVYTQIISGFQREEASTKTSFSTAGSENPDHLAIDVKLLSIDPVKGDLVARLEFTPAGALADPAGISASAKPLVIDLNSSAGKAQLTYKKGERLAPTDVTFNLYPLENQSVANYPFDGHVAALQIFAQSPSGGKDGAPVEYEAIPVAVNYSGALTGYKIDAAESQDQAVGFAEIDMQVSRSATVVAFAVFIMILKWLLALGALFVMLAVTVRGRKIELAMFTWMAGLLFALPPLRNVMPAVPPLGTLSDFLSFFWAEGIVALSLALIVFTWLRRAAK